MTGDRVKISVKFCILGAPGVGKTSLRRNFMGQNFLLSYSTTLGVDFANKIITLDDGTILNLQIWDLAGQTNYLNVTKSFLSHTNAALVVYDSTQPETFGHIKAWLKLLHESNEKNAKKIPLMILRNKVDLLDEDTPSGSFNTEEFLLYLDDYEKITEDYPKSLSTSAKTGKNVEMAFTTLSIVLRDAIE
ncbi:MAG: GTP-binding protein [Candidatus Heimdallarchaeota archaeon]|nr:GTP-binding protein [Candidatus Heimdallarchaeota archaeon]